MGVTLERVVQILFKLTEDVEHNLEINTGILHNLATLNKWAVQNSKVADTEPVVEAAVKGRGDPQGPEWEFVEGFQDPPTGGVEQLESNSNNLLGPKRKLGLNSPIDILESRALVGKFNSGVVDSASLGQTTLPQANLKIIQAQVYKQAHERKGCNQVIGTPGGKTAVVGIGKNDLVETRELEGPVAEDKVCPILKSNTSPIVNVFSIFKQEKLKNKGQIKCQAKLCKRKTKRRPIRRIIRRSKRKTRFLEDKSSGDETTSDKGDKGGVSEGTSRVEGRSRVSTPGLPLSNCATQNYPQLGMEVSDPMVSMTVVLLGIPDQVVRGIGALGSLQLPPMQPGLVYRGARGPWPVTGNFTEKQPPGGKLMGERF